jgi:aminoglycoside phosphotransferase (APT) family kinase protein
LDGNAPTGLDDARQVRFAETFGQFIQSLHAVDVSGHPAGAEHWGYRCGEPVTDEIDAWAESVADRLTDMFDPHQVREAWRRLRDVPPATSPACLVHTDLSAENVLVSPDGRLTGVIDFGGLGIGDCSIDLLYAWSLFDAPARAVLRSASGADDTTWLRARAWAFVGPGLMTIAAYRHTLPLRTLRLTTMVESVAFEVGIRLR